MEEDIPSFCELLEEIEAHTSNSDVIDGDNLHPLGTVQPLMAPVESVVVETTPNPAPFVTKQSPNA